MPCARPPRAPASLRLRVPRAPPGGFPPPLRAIAVPALFWRGSIVALAGHLPAAITMAVALLHRIYFAAAAMVVMAQGGGLWPSSRAIPKAYFVFGVKGSLRPPGWPVSSPSAAGRASHPYGP